MSDQIPKLECDLNTFLWVNEKKLPGFGKLLESWLDVHRNYCLGVSLDHPWAYKERPQIGLLSNATVMAGGIALEEWCTEKVSGEGQNCYGRNDLWVRLRPSSDAKDYQLELKHTRIDLCNSIDTWAQTIDEVMTKANEDATRLNPKNGKQVSASFCTLRFTDKDTVELDNRCRELLIHIQKQNLQKNTLEAIAGIWQGADDFRRVRKARTDFAKDWDNDDVGIIFLAGSVL